MLGPRTVPCMQLLFTVRKPEISLLHCTYWCLLVSQFSRLLPTCPFIPALWQRLRAFPWSSKSNAFWRSKDQVSITGPCTLYNAILRIARNFLETRENIKISTHPFYHINLGWFSWEWSKKKFFFFEKKIQNGRLKKSSFFKIANSQNFFAKISQIRPWVSRIEWC